MTIEEIFHALKERNKEFSCLYGIMDIITNQDLKPDHLFQKAANLIADSTQYPEITGVRIKFQDQIFLNKSFMESETKIFANITFRGKKDGFIEVFYKQEQKIIDEKPFLKEKPLFVDGIAHILGRIAESTYDKEANQKSEIKYQGVFENAGTAMVIIGQDTTVKMVNTEFEKLSGYLRREIEGNFKFTDFVSPENIESINKYFLESTASDKMVSFDEKFHFVGGNENIRNIYAKITKIPGTSESVVSLFDITKQKEVEKKLLESGKRFRELAEMLPETVFEADKNMNLIFANRQAVLMFGYSKQDFENGLNFYNLFVPEDRQRAYENVVKRLKNEIIGAKEYKGLRKDGSTFFLLAHAAHIIKNKTVVGFRIIMVDLTERKKIEAHLWKAQKLEAIGTLAGGIAHNFNNILQAIFGYTELALAEVKKNSPLDNYLQGIYKASQKARNLVKYMLDFSQQSDEKISPIQVNSIAKGVVKLIDSWAPATVEVKHKIMSESFIMGNPSQIHMILMNLCTNALQAMTENGGTLEIGLKDIQIQNSPECQPIIGTLSKGNYLQLIIKDTGTGIEPDVIGSIFDPYFTTKGPSDGTGMGLSMVHGIVENYGGVITVDSEPGKGTTFKIYLPIIEKPPENNFLEHKKASFGTETIFFIDDDLQIANTSSRILERLGYRVTSSTSSTHALEVFQSNPDAFDLIITDMTMPEMTGDRLAMAVKKIRFDIPVILCTGFNEKINFHSENSLGIDAVLMKPTSENALSESIRQLLDNVKHEK